MSDWYILNPDKTTRKAVTQEDTRLAYSILGSTDKIVAQTDIGNTQVSTVFLGLDHSYGYNDDPVLFETMVFRDGKGEDCERYCTYQEAVAGHKAKCATTTSGLSKKQLEKAKRLLEPLLAQESVWKECGAAEEPEQRIDHNDGQDHYKNDIDDLTNRGREWE